MKHEKEITLVQSIKNDIVITSRTPFLTKKPELTYIPSTVRTNTEIVFVFNIPPQT